MQRYVGWIRNLMPGIDVLCSQILDFSWGVVLGIIVVSALASTSLQGSQTLIVGVNRNATTVGTIGATIGIQQSIGNELSPLEV